MVLCSTISSCNKFLEQSPSTSSNIEIKTVDHLEALMMETMRTNNPTLLLSSDLAEIPVTLYDEAGGGDWINWSMTAHYLWLTQPLADLTEQDHWSTIYGHIFRANCVLENVDKVSGSSERKNNVRAVAHFLRAFCNWELLNTYCLPYSEANKKELGIARKTSTSFEQNVSRMTLEDSYAFVEADLQESLKTTVEADSKPWNFSKLVANAFTARYYLYMNNYEKALEYAQKALDVRSTLRDYRTEVWSVDVFGLTMINTWDVMDPTIMYQNPEPYFYSILSTSDMWVFVSETFMNYFDKENDIRWCHISPNFSWMPGFGYDDNGPYPGYVHYSTNIPNGPSVPEMLLTKAECMARLGQWAEAMEPLNTLREKRIKEGDKVNLRATSQQDAIQKCIDERVRELTYTTRWYDIRRYNNNETSFDDIKEITRTLYPVKGEGLDKTKPTQVYKIEANSRRFATPLSTLEIQLSRGQIIQNTY